MKKLFMYSFLAVFFCVFNTGCTTATYGKTFEPIHDSPYYSLKIYTGGLAFKKEATTRLKKEAENYKEQNGYKSYEIISSHYVLTPMSGTEFVVDFKK